MGTRISVDVSQALLAQRVRALAAANRQQRMGREQREREKAQIQGAIDRELGGALGGALGGGGLEAIGGQRRGQTASLSPLADLDAKLIEARLRSGVPEYESRPRVAVTPRNGGWLLEPSDAEFRAKVRGLAPFSFTGDGLYLPGSGPAGAGAYSGGESTGYTTVITSAEVIPIQREPASKTFTSEVMINAFVPASDASARFMECFVDFYFTQFYISRDWHRILSIDGVSTEAMPGEPLTRVEVYALDGTRAMAYGRDRPSGALPPEEGGLGWDDGALLMPSLENDQWHHLAVVQTPGDTPSTRNASLYLNGVRLASRTGLNSGADAWPPFARIRTEFGQRLGAPVVSSSPLVHGIRFTPRALYTGDTYTPPTSITRLA